MTEKPFKKKQSAKGEVIRPQDVRIRPKDGLKSVRVDSKTVIMVPKHHDPKKAVEAFLKKREQYGKRIMAVPNEKVISKKGCNSTYQKQETEI